MGILQAETPVKEWQSSRLNLVGSPMINVQTMPLSHMTSPLTDMLTPLDRPLDTLENLTPMEM